MDKGKEPCGRPVAVDPTAQNASRGQPAFVARPEGAPVYYGFQVLPDVVVEGSTFGKITDFEAQPCEIGDAFVIAPDNSRAGLVWEVAEEPHFAQVLPIEAGRWGVWAVSFPHPMSSRDNVRKNLESILPLLRPKWEQWAREFKQ